LVDPVFIGCLKAFIPGALYGQFQFASDWLRGFHVLTTLHAAKSRETWPTVPERDDDVTAEQFTRLALAARDLASSVARFNARFGHLQGTSKVWDICGVYSALPARSGMVFSLFTPQSSPGGMEDAPLCTVHGVPLARSDFRRLAPACKLNDAIMNW